MSAAVVSCACGCGVQFVGSPGEFWSGACMVADDWQAFMPRHTLGLLAEGDAGVVGQEGEKR